MLDSSVAQSFDQAPKSSKSKENDVSTSNLSNGELCSSCMLPIVDEASLVCMGGNVAHEPVHDSPIHVPCSTHVHSAPTSPPACGGQSAIGVESSQALDHQFVDNISHVLEESARVAANMSTKIADVAGTENQACVKQARVGGVIPRSLRVNLRATNGRFDM
ncbi:hypothetical protein V6N11_072213 [Hibiscus sabdariffa]|uniref:Uncharacterized protein n=1 Tax=Hibiscus sabdariffa TaxID=183260 RepID=A0ABR2U2M6_9ROSI